MAKEFDVWGRRVPRFLNEVFASRRKFLQWLEKLEQMRGELLTWATDPAGRYLQIQEVQKHFAAIRAIVRRALPFQECECSANDDCPKCANQRWVNVDGIPDRLKNLPQSSSVEDWPQDPA